MQAKWLATHGAFPPRVQATDTPGEPLQLPTPRSSRCVCIVIHYISHETPGCKLGSPPKGVEGVSLSFRLQVRLDRSSSFSGIQSQSLNRGKITDKAHGAKCLFANASPTFPFCGRAGVPCFVLFVCTLAWVVSHDASNQAPRTIFDLPTATHLNLCCHARL